MAAVATETITIKINEIDVEVPRGELIVEAVKRIGLEIPVFCYHPRMKPVGMCRMCIVEVGFLQPDGSVRKMPKPQAACTLPAQDNMVVYTDTEAVHKDRKGVLEFLLINHPLDCPICDRGGECPLQNNTLFYGPSTSRFVELKRHAPKAFPLSKYVTLDLERCIQCGRCVRFTEEISGDSQLAFRFRGSHMQPSTFELRDFTSKFSGNVIEICPVGALTNREYRFRARPWDLETKPAICTVCSNGCNVWFDYRVGKMVRINGRTNEGINEEWTCDRGKFGHEFYNHPDRLTKPLIRKGDALHECDWPEAYAAILENFELAGNKAAAIVDGAISNEGLYLLKKLFNEKFKSDVIDYNWYKTPSVDGIGVQTKIAEIENKPSILVFGTNTADDLPIIHLRVRKAWFKNGARVVVAHSEETDVDPFATEVLRYRSGTAHVLAKALLAGAKGDEAAVSQLAVECGVDSAKIKAAAEILKDGTIITAESMLNLDESKETLLTLNELAKASGSEMNCYATGANHQGAREIGLHSDEIESSAPGILEQCSTGRVRALWLAGCNPFESVHADKAAHALESVDFLVVQATTKNDALPYASVVLPMTAPAEEDGTYVNCERRVQKFTRVLDPKGEAKAAWRTCAELLLRGGLTKPYFSVAEIFNEIAATRNSFTGLSYKELDESGTFLS